MTDPDETPQPAATPDDPGATLRQPQPETLTRREMRAMRARRRRPILKGIIITLVVALAAVVGLGAYAAFRLNGNLQSLDIKSDLLRPNANATTDPTTGHTAMNILLMGVDSRAGANASYGNADDARSGERSDTTMLVHLAANRRSAIVVSIPRDTVMLAPPAMDGGSSSASGSASSSTEATGSSSGSATPSPTSTPVGCDINAPTSAWEKRMFNENIEIGGADCVVATLMHNTNVSIDHVMSVDFTGFKEIVNAMGTVEICTTSPIDDNLSGLKLSAGRHDLDGEQALAFVRTRHGVGDGSDLGRLRLQQDFAAAVVRKATSTGVLLNPGKLYGVLNAATKSLTTDPGLANFGALSGLANQLREMRPANVRFLTAPTEPYPGNRARVQLSDSAAQLWEIIREDKPWPDDPSASASASATTTAAPALVPSEVVVAVENASGTDGMGNQVAKALRVQGFQVPSVGSADQPADGVVVHHTTAQLAQAQSVARAFPGAVLKADGTEGEPVRVSVGRGAKPVVLVPNREGSDPLPAQPLKAQPIPAGATPTAAGTPTLEAKVASDDVCSDTSKG